jgi:ribosomal protein L37AE/L43A
MRSTVSYEIHCPQCAGNVFKRIGAPVADQTIVCASCNMKWSGAEFDKMAKLQAIRLHDDTTEFDGYLARH